MYEVASPMRQLTPVTLRGVGGSLAKVTNYLVQVQKTEAWRGVRGSQDAINHCIN